MRKAKKFSAAKLSRALGNPEWGWKPGEAGRYLAGLLNDPATAKLSPDEVFAAVEKLVWRNGAEIANTLWVWDEHELTGVGFEHSDRIMAALTITAMMDGKGCGWATLRLTDEDMWIPWGQVLANHGPRLIRAADLPTWAALPDVVTVYRGDRADLDPNQIMAAQWTLDVGVAAKFAFSHLRPGAIYKAEVPRDTIMHYSNQRGEKEVIIEPVEEGISAILLCNDQKELERLAYGDRQQQFGNLQAA